MKGYVGHQQNSPSCPDSGEDLQFPDSTLAAANTVAETALGIPLSLIHMVGMVHVTEGESGMFNV